jgi:hypothetical protein
MLKSKSLLEEDSLMVLVFLNKSPHVDDFLCFAGNLAGSSHVLHRKAPTWRESLTTLGYPPSFQGGYDKTYPVE